MKRKLVKQGISTLMISLPTKWLKEFDLGKGDEVDVEQIDEQLIISKDSVQSKKETALEVHQYTESAIRTSIVNAYRTGYERLKVNYKGREQFQIVSNTLRDYLIGFEITKKEETYCIIENFTEPAEEKFDVFFTKIFYNIRLLLQITKERLQHPKETYDYQSVVSKIHQYDNFCRRVIAKKGMFGSRANLLWSFLTLLIHGQRELYHLHKYLDKTKTTHEITLLEDLEKLFSALEEGYTKKNQKKLDEVHQLEKKFIYGKVYNQLEKSRSNVVTYHLAVAAREFYLSASPLLGLLLQEDTSNA